MGDGRARSYLPRSQGVLCEIAAVPDLQSERDLPFEHHLVISSRRTYEDRNHRRWQYRWNTYSPVHCAWAPGIRRQVARSGDVVIVSIPVKSVPKLPRDLFAGLPSGVVVVDTGNYYPQRDGHIA